MLSKRNISITIVAILITLVGLYISSLLNIIEPENIDNKQRSANFAIAETQLVSLLPTLIGCSSNLVNIGSPNIPLKIWSKQQDVESRLQKILDRPLYTLYRARFKSRVEPLEVFANIAIPKNTEGPFPLAIFYHGLGSDPDRVFGLPSPDYTGSAGARLAERGFIVIAPYIYSDTKWNSQVNILYPLMELIVASGMASIDLAEQTLNIDDTKIVSYGISFGGRASRLLSAYDKRVDLAVVNGSHPDPTSFVLAKGFSSKQIDPMSFFSNSPCSSEQLDSYLRIYPRPIILENGKQDPQIYGLESLVKRLQEEEPKIDIQVITYRGGHIVNPDNETLDAIEQVLNRAP